jgi:hypothetical protein
VRSSAILMGRAVDCFSGGPEGSQGEFSFLFFFCFYFLCFLLCLILLDLNVEFNLSANLEFLLNIQFAHILM